MHFEQILPSKSSLITSCRTLAWSSQCLPSVCAARRLRTCRAVCQILPFLAGRPFFFFFFLFSTLSHHRAKFKPQFNSVTSPTRPRHICRAARLGSARVLDQTTTPPAKIEAAEAAAAPVALPAFDKESNNHRCTFPKAKLYLYFCHTRNDIFFQLSSSLGPCALPSFGSLSFYHRAQHPPIPMLSYSGNHSCSSTSMPSKQHLSAFQSGLLHQERIVSSTRV